MCPCQIAHCKKSVIGDLGTDDGDDQHHQSLSSWPLLRLQPLYRDHYRDHDHTPWQPQKARARSYEVRSPPMQVPYHQAARGWICRMTSEDARLTWSTQRVRSRSKKTSMLWNQQQWLSNMLPTLVSTGHSQMVTSKTYLLRDWWCMKHDLLQIWHESLWDYPK